ncbi:related to peroxisomal short-chain alcohol dehydrogenase [Phialocephala subalpina]|uniref:Related to peroxisomal short-chain alcohol dehydrogenase n=1 Tax=Phialocephala subalpina TaxID=576137 RepID=A0A1L7WMT1_9HELO|nr:related to peroxisomal short-chain alcohol dehydrogenase [Phialocephala subalpina]
MLADFPCRIYINSSIVNRGLLASSALPPDSSSASPSIRHAITSRFELLARDYPPSTSTMPPPRGTPNLLEGPGDYDVTTVVHSSSYPAISPLTSPTHAGKSVFIAGASRGIGLAIAVSFAQAGSSQIAIGARSDLTSLKQTLLDAATKAGRPEPEILCIKLDITSQSSTEEAAKLVEKAFGKLDIVINNAGILRKPALIADSDPDAWWETWNVNLRGPYLITRAFLPLLLKGGDKTIITTSSVGAHLISPTLSAYQPSKLAVLRFMQFVAKEYESQGVLTYTIHPGNVVTDMLEDAFDVSAELRALFTETPEISADTLTFLTREKRDWLAGRYINVTWDMPELMSKENEIVKGDKLKVKLDF